MAETKKNAGTVTLDETWEERMDRQNKIFKDESIPEFHSVSPASPRIVADT